MKEHKLHITARNQDRKPVGEARIDIHRKETVEGMKRLETNKSGEAVVLLPSGEYKLNAFKKNDFITKMNITVDENEELQLDVLVMT